MTPGQHQQPSRAGALELSPGTWSPGLGPRTPHALCRDLLTQLEARDPADRYTRLYGVVDHDNIHTAKAGQHWLAAHPRVPRLLLPTSCPRAYPSAWACGDVHDGGTRTHPRTR